MNEVLYQFLKAHYVSSVWTRDGIPRRRRLFYRARAAVVFDRVLNQEYERAREGA